MATESLAKLNCYVIVGALAGICFVNSIYGDFVFDDSEAILNNKDVSSNTSFAEVFSNDFWGTNLKSKLSHKSYRPLTVLTFRLNCWLAGGLKPFGFHAANIILHVVVSLVFLNLCRRLIGGTDSVKEKTAFFAAVLYAVHPVHTEAVSGIVGRAELTSSLLFFITIQSYIISCCREKQYLSILWLLLSVSLGGCAMFFKEQGITALGFCVFYDIILHMDTSAGLLTPRFFLRMFAMVLAVVGLVTIRINLMGSEAPTFQPWDNPASFEESLFIRVVNYHYIYAINFWLLLNPWWLCFDWSMGCIPVIKTLTDYRLCVVVILWVGFGALVLYALLGKCGHYRRTVLFSLLLLLIPFLPASNIFFKVGFVVAERVLYIPSAGFCLLVSTGLSKLTCSCIVLKRNLYIFAALLVSMYVIRSVQRSSQWLTEETLFMSGARVCPLNAKVHYNIGKVLVDRGRFAEGKEAYQEAIRLHPEYEQALNNLGNLFKDTDQPNEAEVMLERAVKADPKFAAAWMNLGIVKASLNKSMSAEECYLTAIKFRKSYPDAYYNLGNLYIQVNKPQLATDAFRKAIALERDHANAWNNLGLLYENQEQLEDAEATMKQAIAIMPNHPQFHYSLGVVLGKLQRYDEGEKYLLSAVALNPKEARYYANLGVIYHLKKLYAKAEAEYYKALKLEPDLVFAKENLKKLRKTRDNDQNMK